MRDARSSNATPCSTKLAWSSTEPFHWCPPPFQLVVGTQLISAAARGANLLLGLLVASRLPRSRVALQVSGATEADVAEPAGPGASFAKTRADAVERG